MGDCKIMNSPKVSILIPVFKVPEKYLRRCIESCISQTLKEIEIIIVDDGSPDDCGKICDEYKNKDCRVKVIHKDNGGLSAARNTAYDQSLGEYITFLDGDDYLEKNACEISLSYAHKYDSQVVMFNQITEYPNSSRECISFSNDEINFNSKSQCKKLQERVLDFNGKIAQVFCKLIKKDLLDTYRIRHVDYLRQGAEGFVFNIALFEHAESAYYIPKPLLHYTYNENSISHTADDNNNHMIVKCFEYVKDYIQGCDNAKELESALYKRMLYVICTTAITGYFNPHYNVPYKTKKKQFDVFLNEPLVTCALKNFRQENVGFQRKIILLCIIFKQYWFLSLLGWIRRNELSNR